MCTGQKTGTEMFKATLSVTATQMPIKSRIGFILKLWYVHIIPNGNEKD